ncbi:MAG: TlpA family protein disulfide reductase [Lutibacter sp.]|nr:TlpA family protein disulfide reductase [Lutibacter sp.]
MKKLWFIFILIMIVGCKTDTKMNPENGDINQINEAEKPFVETYTYETLKPLLNKSDDKTYVVNFWATWCKPCVEELPAFEKLHKLYAGKNVTVILVSLDFPNQIESRLIPFMIENNLKSKVIAMVDTDHNSWIPKVDESWSGAIPATLIYNKNKRTFYEQSLTYKQLEQEVTNFLKTK